LIFKMRFVQCDSARHTLGTERFHIRIIGGATLTSSMGYEENIPLARKELPEREFRTGILFTAVIVEDDRKGAVSLRLVKKPMERKLPARKCNLVGACALSEDGLLREEKCGQ